jgi:hypothetical protein
MMRSILAVAMLASLGASAQVVLHNVPTIDLDKPGALAKLEHENPGHYQLVMDEVKRVEQMTCKPAQQLLRASEGRTRCSSHLIYTSYPAKTNVSVFAGSAIYSITAYIDPSLDRLARAK